MQPRDPLIRWTEEVDDPPDHFVQIDGPGLDHRLDVGPVLRAIEERLEHREIVCTEDWDRRTGDERRLFDVRRRSLVERVICEEEVDRRVAPKYADLAIALDRRDVLISPRDFRWKHLERRACVLSEHEAVEIDIACRARLHDVQAQRNRAPESMWNVSAFEGPFDREHHVYELGHQGRRG